MYILLRIKIMKFRCEACNYESDRKLNFERHNKSKLHLKLTKSISFKCDQCDHEADSNTNLNRHKKTHLDTQIHNFECLACDLSFRDLSNLKDHLKSSDHGKNVHTKYTECLKGLIPHIDVSKRGVYVKKIKKIVPKKKTQKIIKNQENSEIIHKNTNKIPADLENMSGDDYIKAVDDALAQEAVVDQKLKKKFENLVKKVKQEIPNIDDFIDSDGYLRCIDELTNEDLKKGIETVEEAAAEAKQVLI